MSPSFFSESYANVWGVISTGSLFHGDVNNNSALRPAVSLIPATTVTGSGTSVNPYVVS